MGDETDRLRNSLIDKPEVVLRRERVDQDYSELLARVTHSGALELEGYDAGPAVEHATGDVDFEYWLQVSAEHVPGMLLRLLQERFRSVHELRAWLDQHAVPYEFTSL